MPFPGVPWCALPCGAVLLCGIVRCCAAQCGGELMVYKRSHLGLAWRIINSAPLSRAHRSAVGAVWYCCAVLCHAVPCCVLFAVLVISYMPNIIRSVTLPVLLLYVPGTNIEIKIHSSCNIEYFVETHLCKLCVILRSRVLRVVCPH